MRNSMLNQQPIEVVVKARKDETGPCDPGITVDLVDKL